MLRYEEDYSHRAAPTVKQAMGDHKAIRGGHRSSKADELFVSLPMSASIW